MLRLPVLRLVHENPVAQVQAHAGLLLTGVASALLLDDLQRLPSEAPCAGVHHDAVGLDACLVPDLLHGLGDGVGVAAVGVHEHDLLEAVVDQALGHVLQHVHQCLEREGDGALEGQVVGRVTVAHQRSHQDPGLLRYTQAHLQRREGVGVDGHVLTVLLRGAHGY